jgi:hypothetical protein
LTRTRQIEGVGDSNRRKVEKKADAWNCRKWTFMRQEEVLQQTRPASQPANQADTKTFIDVADERNRGRR